MGIKRGTIVRAVLSGDFGKPRPAVIIQSDEFITEDSSLILCPITSDLEDTALVRLLVLPDANNGLLLPSHVMVDKINVVLRKRIGLLIGQLDDETMLQLNQSIALFLGIAS